MFHFSRRTFSTLLPVALAASVLGIASKPAEAQFTISNFNGTGPDFTYGGFTGTQGPTYYDINGQANGGAGFGYAPPNNNFTADANGAFELTALTLPGNQSDIQILIDTNDTGAANDYLYYYAIPVAAFNSATFTTATTTTLNNPDYVLDSANGFALVGSGPAFAPNLSSVNSIQIQGSPFGPGNFNYRFDNFAITSAPSSVPEPGSVALFVGMSATGGVFAVRRRRARK